MQSEPVTPEVLEIANEFVEMAEREYESATSVIPGDELSRFALFMDVARTFDYLHVRQRLVESADRIATPGWRIKGSSPTRRRLCTASSAKIEAVVYQSDSERGNS